MTLTVADLERLAKAGVQVNLTERMVDNIQPDFAPATDGGPQFPPRSYPLVDAFWERWRRNKAAFDSPHHDFGDHWERFHFYAAEVGDVVQCFVNDKERFAVIEDSKHLFPSDALLAAVHLWEKTK